MTMFVHLTSEKNIKSILRNGISRIRKRAGRPHGIYALPVVRNFYISHQWLRELKRSGKRTILGIYFRIPDDEVIWIGHYNRSHQQLTSAEAAALMMEAENKEGYEVIIPRRIERNEIHKIRSLPQVIGWRFYPGAHGDKPCGCPLCQRGEYGAKRLRKAYEDSFAK